eukprot:2185073-Prymnesium_polylepis.2
MTRPRSTERRVNWASISSTEVGPPACGFFDLRTTLSPFGDTRSISNQLFPMLGVAHLTECTVERSRQPAEFTMREQA